MRKSFDRKPWDPLPGFCIPPKFPASIELEFLLIPSLFRMVRVAFFARVLLIAVLISCRDSGAADETGGLSPTSPTVASDRFTPAEPATQQDIFGQTIRSTSHLSPMDELAGFHVPEGFQIDLVAAEPTIAKPMNMAFDESGRLWVTQSTQYPFPAKNDETGADSVVILEDKDKDGSFESSHVFADGLNIPIGMLPYGDGVLCFSIPNILYLQDTDRDGVCDRRDVVLGPFDTTRDTHGMVNSLRMGDDGWVYACHGFNNQSNIAGKDGHTIAMNSGNVFRFRPDGSRVELYTQGQVNPFGMARDRWGFWYAADCHSKPISQLIRGGCYPSFGRPDDGLGFVPPMMDHLHGSTAIAGLVHSKDSSFPVALEDNFLSGNVMTCRVNRNHIEYRGATAKAVAMPDLLTSDDPWFRPVDLQFGPDGSLYIADFYNKIIGHYEVPLNHPDRDRTSGRIWRIRWIGGGEVIQRDSKPKPASLTGVISDAPAMDLDALRRQAVELDPQRDAMQLQASIESCTRSSLSLQSNEGTNELERNADWLMLMATKIDREVDPVLWQTNLIGLRDTVTALRNASADRFARWVHIACGVAIGTDTNAKMEPVDAPRIRALVKVLLSLKDSVSVSGVLTIAERQSSDVHSTTEHSKVLQDVIQGLAEVAGDSEMDRLLAVMEKTAADPTAMADQVLNIARRQSQQRGKILESLVHRGHAIIGILAHDWSDHINEQERKWGSLSLQNWRGQAAKGNDRNAWGVEKREREPLDGIAQPAGQFFSSLALGEAYTGTWVSSPMPAPMALQFWIVGHNGLPADPDHQKNYVALVVLDENGAEKEVAYREFPPRSDVARLITWDLSKFAGQDIQLRVVDGDAGPSFAWIGVGESSQPGLNPEEWRKKWQRIVAFVETFGWPALGESMQSISLVADNPRVDWGMRFQLVKTKYKSSEQHWVELVEFAAEHHWYDLLQRMGIRDAVLSRWEWGSDSERLFEVAKVICQRCSFREQEQFVSRLSKHRGAVMLLASLAEKGVLSRDSLRVLPKSWWESLPEDQQIIWARLRPEAESTTSRSTLVESKAILLESIQPDLTVGSKMFMERCALCHKLGDVGKVIGPQLEGVGTRGIARLTEDILWPDRNVDEAFRMTMLMLNEGESVNGLVSDRRDESILVTDQQGKQRRILESDIEQEKQSKLSLMPGNFEEVMTDHELASLIGYLRNAASKK
jgi:putative heme-binding domain-containing protein